jgi:hypothetical protein
MTGVKFGGSAIGSPVDIAEMLVSLFFLLTCSLYLSAQSPESCFGSLHLFGELGSSAAERPLRF